MSSKWETLYQFGIFISGGLVTLTIVLAWARSVRKYWLEQMNRETKRQWEKDGDANGQ